MIPFVSFLPKNLGGGYSQGLRKLQLKPRRVLGPVGGPAGVFFSIDGLPRIVAVAGLSGGRGDLDKERVLGSLAYFRPFTFFLVISVTTFFPV